ncbi:hypothetical protein EKK97_04340 [Billgrantia tianxiuensis]|jgi:hypothetical protein|uniref:Myb-like domain-containing protein n=1 Tax=Billgrantia tianxiuensis TaxID=2497861 RepID=A0A6I6SHX0_9GAMM|nr:MULTISPECIES: hypothetical protein [Halomonas]MCE8033249.1 hypothetical protein [Halomonas sp. MCCC 1A11057]QHC48991.1 hypothetical protein EKK97_04340 [Halomonas tianxiuensis]
MRRRNRGVSREWTPSELALLECHYLDMTWRELQARHFPHRTSTALQAMAHKLGLKKRVVPITEKQPWTEEELLVVIQHFPALKAPEIRRRFLPHRTVIAIRHVAKRFGLKAFSTERWAERELAILRRDFPQGGVSQVKRALPHRSVEAIKQRAKAESLSYMPQGDGDKGDRWSAEELQRLEEHRHLPAEELARLFPHRPKRAVINKRYKLRWAPVQQWSKAELQRLSENLDAPLEVLCQLFPDRPREGIRIKRGRLRRGGR